MAIDSLWELGFKAHNMAPRNVLCGEQDSINQGLHGHNFHVFVESLAHLKPKPNPIYLYRFHIISILTYRSKLKACPQ